MFAQRSFLLLCYIIYELPTLYGVEDRVDLIVYVYRVLLVVCGGLWVKFSIFLTFIAKLASRLICGRPVLDIGGLG